MDHPSGWQSITNRMIYDAACWAIFNVVYQEFYPNEHTKHIRMAAVGKRHHRDVWYPTTQVMLTISSLWGSRNWSNFLANFLDVLSGIPFSVDTKQYIWMRFESTVQHQLIVAAKHVLHDNPQLVWSGDRPGTDELFDDYEPSHDSEALPHHVQVLRGTSQPAYVGHTTSSSEERDLHRSTMFLNPEQSL